MASVKIAVIVSCFVLMIFGSANAIKCYNCTGEPDSDCAKAVGQMQVESCQGISMCHFTDVRSGHIRTVSRGCTKFGSVDLCTLLYQLAGANPSVMRVFDCKTCWSDLCNVQVTA